jgi:hypothetical protein
MKHSSWTQFAERAADIAEAARRRLVGPDGVAIGYLATTSAHGRPRIAPVCPIFCGHHLYLSIGNHTPKAQDLRARRGFALHAFLGANDEEVQISGEATEVFDANERSRVHAAIPFKAFDAEDPIFRLEIDRALWVHWERAGQPDTKAVRRRWRSIP